MYSCVAVPVTARDHQRTSSSYGAMGLAISQYNWGAT